MGTSWAEYNADVSLKLNVGQVADVFTGVNYFNYSNPQDRNNDNFTDLAIQDRISIFQKWNFERKDNRLFSLAARYFHEDRWGGELDWTPEFRGTDQIYGESIFTDRFELLGQYELFHIIPITKIHSMGMSHMWQIRRSHLHNSPGTSRLIIMTY